MKFNKIFKKKKCICCVVLIIIVVVFIYRSRKVESFDDDIEKFYNESTNLIEPNQGHATHSMLRHGRGSSVSSSSMSKPQGMCCVHYGCVSCGGKYPNQKKYGCKKWQSCDKTKAAKHDYQGECTGCGAEKNAILSTQKDNWW